MTQTISSHSGVVDLVAIPGHGIVVSAGTTVPADGEVGFSPGCLFIDVDASSGSQLHINIGTYASANFDPLAAEGALSKTGGTMTGTLTSQNIIVQNTYSVVIGNSVSYATSYDGSTSVTPTLGVVGTTADDSSVELYCASTTATIAACPIIHIIKDGAAAVGGDTIVTDNEILGGIQWHGADGADFKSIAGQITAEVDGTPGAGDMPGAIVFATTASGAETATEVFRINASQNLAIANGNGLIVGAETPEVTSYDGATDVTPEVQIQGTGGADSSILMLASSATTTVDACPILHLIKSDNGTIGSHTIVGSATVLGAIQWHGDDGVDYEAVAASIRVEMDGSPGTGNLPSKMIIGTNTGGDTTLDYVTIRENGGLELDQASHDTAHLSLRDTTDVSHGMTTLPLGQDVAAGDYFTVSKADGATGGAYLTAVRESSATGEALHIEAWSGAPDTTDTVSSTATIMISGGLHDGANGDLDMVADSNLFAVTEIDSSGIRQARLLLKADDGELHLGNTTLVTLADEEDDVQLVRALQLNAAAPGASGIVQSPYDNPLVNYDTLHALGIVGEKNPDDGFHFLRLQPCLALHAGAIWQMFNDMMDIAKALPGEMQKKLPERIRNRLTKEP